MIIEPKLPEKVKYLTEFSFQLVAKLTEKTKVQKFIGGRPGYDKELLFFWLLMKKVTNWDYRTIASMAGISHPTLTGVRSPCRSGAATKSNPMHPT